MKTISLSLLILISFSTFSQYKYEATKENPFGRLNPNAPKQTGDFKKLIGDCNCKSLRKKPDGTWAKPINMIWRWKYIMNGMAVQDETLKEDKIHSGSIRQYNKDSLRWYVHYYSTNVASPKLATWEGNKKQDGTIVLYMKQKAPNGTEGFSRLTFYDISNKGYKWKGEWVDKTEKVVFPFWKIECKK